MVIEKSKAISIAERFVGQYHDNISFVDAVLEEDAWRIIFSLELKAKKILVVLVDANAGKIISYS